MIHGHSSHVGVGRGTDKKHYSCIWAGLVIQKLLVNAEKVKQIKKGTDGPTNGPMGQQMDKAGF